MKVAIVYDRVNKWGGAERVLLALHEMFPKAPLFTSVYDSKKAPWASVFPKVYTSFLHKIPFSSSRHEPLAPLMPLAFESFNFNRYELVISVTSEAAKGLITKPQTKHLCYILTPTRYLWSGRDEYFKSTIIKIVTKPIVSYLRSWDKVAAQRPDVFVGISTAVQKRVRDYYKRESELVYPPVEIDKFEYSDSAYKKKENYYLVVARLVSYKRVDLAIQAFNELKKQLVVVGEGREEEKLKSLAKPNIKFVKRLTDKELARYYQRARALIFPQVEDFGLVAVEAQAAGTPVIAYKSGGAQDTIIDGKTGIFFVKQSKESLIKAIRRFEKVSINKKDLMKNAEKYSKEKFQEEFGKVVKKLL